MGTAYQMGLYEIDTPLAKIGVDGTMANWSRNVNQTNFWPLITPRHLLSQVSGIGKVRNVELLYSKL